MVRSMFNIWCYADDAVMVSENLDDLQCHVAQFIQTCKYYKMVISAKENTNYDHHKRTTMM